MQCTCSGALISRLGGRGLDGLKRIRREQHQSLTTVEPEHVEPVYCITCVQPVHCITTVEPAYCLTIVDLAEETLGADADKIGKYLVLGT